MLAEEMKEILIDNGFVYHPPQKVDFDCDPILTDAWFGKEFPRYDERYDEQLKYHLMIYNCGYFELASPYNLAETGLPFSTIEDILDLKIVLNRILGVDIEL